jgi:hypothetical protein
MTVVIAFRFLQHVAVFADCRVSYGDSSEVDDNLQKLYQIDKRMVLGFSGPLEGAYQVIQAVKRNIRPEGRRLVASNLQMDVERWIRHEYQQIKQPDRKGLSFLIATVEPLRRERPTYKRGCPDGADIEISEPKWVPRAPELSVLVLKPSRSKPHKLVRRQGRKFMTIGVGREAREAIQRELERLYGFALKLRHVQAEVAVNSVMATLMKQQIDTVGGLFPGALLSADGINWIRYHSPSAEGDVTLAIEDGHYVQIDNRTGRRVPLKTIWEWFEERSSAPPRGSSGVFEDPGLRHAVQRFRAAESESAGDSEERNP